MSDRTIRIGGASGFWGDAVLATRQLLGDAMLDYIVYDYLAEITMSIMARARAKRPEAGFAADFVSAALAPNLKVIAERGIKVISNAGGVNPTACADAVRAAVKQAGLDLKVAEVTGDDLMPALDDVSAGQVKEMFSGGDLPPKDKVFSANAYFGAFPIAKALDEGADIVVTGRCVDSAVTLGAAIHAFGWGDEDFDLLASGSLAGHILECGVQATGGNFTDWEEVANNLDTIGYPICELSADGSFIVTKPEGTGGKVSRGTVGEQMLYEIGDPQAYALPDVVCDFSDVSIEETGPNRVKVSPARGLGKPSNYKVSLTYQDGFRGGHMFSFYGFDAARKARHYGEKAIERARNILRSMNAPDFSETSIEILGAGSQFGDQSASDGAREVVLKLAASHMDERGVGLLLREAVGLGLATPPGLSGFAGTRPRPSPMVKLFSFLWPQSDVPVSIEIDGRTIDWKAPDSASVPSDCVRSKPPETPVLDGDIVEVPLIELAFARSGDKGDHANIGVMARDPAYLPYIWHSLNEQAVAQRFAHFLNGSVSRYLLPGSSSINFLLENALGGGGVASLRNDPQAKGYSQILLAHPIKIPASLLPERGAQ
ncbi:MAG: acyclic terpene utilization AtuA family protein [Pseudomonadota bacterium]